MKRLFGLVLFFNGIWHDPGAHFPQEFSMGQHRHFSDDCRVQYVLPMRFYAFSSGRITVKQLPSSTWLDTSMVPGIRSMIRFVMESPSPLPFFIGIRAPAVKIFQRSVSSWRSSMPTAGIADGDTHLISCDNEFGRKHTASRGEFDGILQEIDPDLLQHLTVCRKICTPSNQCRDSDAFSPQSGSSRRIACRICSSTADTSCGRSRISCFSRRESRRMLPVIVVSWRVLSMMMRVYSFRSASERDGFLQQCRIGPRWRRAVS